MRRLSSGSAPQGDEALERGRSQQVAYDSDGLGSIGAIDPKIVTARQQDRLIFRDVLLARVIAEVNRYRPGRIIVVDPQLDRTEVVAKFSR